ncbi:LOW QUALITY PROTEIN: tenascin-like [Periophthalmus magnuspinnatus]|uniref:LOW QUALITY PROTEIN: tenascin-like n=1 Tax=Periophthalmus magnuspinnatus TaxID=409849 RepID=UPI002436C050|nr:LOW QUALITY PROTEIN: tenascin-like [Periophthalmus magnuspinnatus]
MVQFYTAITESILTFSITVVCWGQCQGQRLQCIVRSAEKIIALEDGALWNTEDLLLSQESECVFSSSSSLTATSAPLPGCIVLGQRSSSQDSIKVVVSEGCVAQADAADGATGGKELSLSPSSPLVLTHQIRLVPSGPGSGSCGCDGDLAALRARVDRLEREVSALREKCGDPENPGCCSSRESKGPGCSISPDSPLCPNDCSDQGRCVDGRCECFPGFSGADCANEECPVDCGQRGHCVDGECQCDPGFSGPDCSQSSCPGNCNNRGRCVNGHCQCDPGFSDPDCSQSSCPGNCNNRGRCVNGKCVCESGFIGESCADITCPGNCNNRGRCINGKCVCNSGFGGEKCTDKTCPGNCNNRGRCVDGKCQCNPGFSGPNCSQSSCPRNCNNRGLCVNGKCVCESGFGGESCADKTCPGNCNNRGRCVNGQCICEPGFDGLDCAGKMCPENCNGRGVCVDGKCVCESGFGGENCGDKTCPGNCNNRGHCVDGKCVCARGFKGVDCAERACPNECSGRGKCMEGRCVCEGGFTGADCSAKGCPGNCNNRGRCVKGKCVCRRGFSGADCGQCQDGLTGPSCDTVMSAVEQLRTKDLTQSSVTVVWTQPPVQYESYLLSFTSKKDGSEVEAEVPGSVSSFTQSGLAPGQSYSVTVTGQTGEGRGAPNSALFNTLPSGPSDLRVVKTSTSSAVVQWEPSQSDIDRYRLTVSRGDGVGRSQELTFEPGTSSAHITQLEPGLRYDITLVAEKGRSQSEPVTTHATPGSANVLVAALTVTPASDDKLNLPIENNYENIEPPETSRPENIPKLNATKVIQRIQVQPSIGDNRDTFQPKGESYQMVEFGTNLESNKEINLKKGDTGTGLTTPEPKRTCLNRVKVTHGRLGQKNKTSGCIEGETDPTAESSSGPHRSEQEPSQNEDSEVPKDRSLVQHHPLQRLLTDTFNKLNVTTFAIHLSEPSSVDENAEIVAQQIIQGLTPISTIKKSIKYLDGPQITSLSSKRSQTKSTSPTSAPQIPVLTNAETIVKEEDDSTVENFDDSRPEKERQTPREGGLSKYRRTQPNRTVFRRLQPNLWHLRNKTGLILRTSDDSSPSSTKMTSTSTDSPYPATEKQFSSSDDGVDLNNNEDSERAKQAKVPVLEHQHVPHARPFQNKSHPNSRFFRQPIRLLNNKTQTSETREVGVEGIPTSVAPGETEQNTAKDRLPLARGTFNRSRLVFPRRPNQYTGPFQNRTRLFLRPPQRGPIRKNWTLQNEPQSRNSNLDIQDKAEAGVEAKIQASTSENPNLNSDNSPKSNENLKDRSHFSKLFEGDSTAINVRAQVSNNRDDPGNEESIRQTNESEQMKGQNIGETDSGKDDTESFTQRIEIENDEQEKNVKSEVNDPKIPQDEQNILENRGTSNMEEEDLTINADSDKSAKDIGQNIPESFAKQERNKSNSGTSSQVTKTVDQFGDRDMIILAQTEEKPAETDGKQNNSYATLSRRRFKPGAQLIGRVPQRFQGKIFARNGVGGLDQPERSDQNVVATRGQKDTEFRGHEIKNVSANEKLDLTKEERVSTDKRGEPSRTVIRRLRPNLWQLRNKTAPIARRGNGSLPSLSKKNLTSTNMPMRAAEMPSLSDREVTHVKFSKAFEGEKQPLSDNGQDDSKTLGNSGESEDPGELRRLDEVFSESDYKLTVLGKGSGVLSQLHKLVISTGPEPPTDLIFNHVTEDSVTVSWTKPKSKVSGFKLTYTHAEEGEPFSVSLDQGNSSIDLTRLSPGSTYEVSILSVLGLDESDPISRTFQTLPDPPTDLRAVNVTDYGALLLWRPALAAVEKYTIVYGSGTDSKVRVIVSGNTAEEQLNGLQPSTTYTVTISSELDNRKSTDATTSFTTTASGSDGAGDLRATNVKPRTTTLSWKPPSRPVIGYKLTYQTEGQKKEVSVGATVTQLNLTRLFPGAEYSVELEAQGGGGGEVLYTTFTTGSLRFPFPSDCSQEQLNGLSVSGLVDIFPLGRQGAALSVWCDMETDGGGWTVFQRRKDGSVDFFRSWKEYVQGFGDPSGEFWLGLDALHTLTTSGRMTLRVDLRDGHDFVFAQYSMFEVAKKNYRLTVAGYSGTAGDSMSYHNNRIFSTKDRDPVSFITRCAMSYRGGWWYKNCHEANLNGLYGINSKHQGIIWTSWKGKEASIPFTEMKMRPTDFIPNKNNYRY